MSKAKPPDPPKPAEAPKQFETATLEACAGRRIKCPSCGKLATVAHARGAMLRNQPVSSKFWMRLDCSGCGARLEKIKTQVEVEVAPAPPAQKRPVGQVVGHFIKCPVPNCGQHSKAVWTIDDGTVIDCPVHQRRSVDSTLEVEIIA